MEEEEEEEQPGWDFPNEASVGSGSEAIGGDRPDEPRPVRHDDRQEASASASPRGATGDGQVTRQTAGEGPPGTDSVFVSKSDENARRAPPVEPNDYAVLVAHVGDQPTTEDTLGFKPYVEAIADFLTNQVTKPPLTLSIEGEWGSGKSSFMLQLENELRARNVSVVRFNAWRHDKDDAMWAAFAMEFTRKLSCELPRFDRWRAHLKLFFRRFKWERGWMDMARLFLMAAVVLVILLLPIFGRERISDFVAPPQPATTPGSDGKAITANDKGQDGALRKVIGAGGLLAYLVLVISLAVKLKGVIGNPLTINLKQHLNTPDYRSRVAFIERFHEDFVKVVEVYGAKKKVYVFIDDLDRCEVPKAADLMQALNLMISDSSQLIFIMGLDREKVAAGLAVKYEKLLPYLAPPAAGNGASPKAAFDPVLGLEYGYNFMEKFIQLPFLVPQASEEQVQGFLDHIFGATNASGSAQTARQPQAAAAGKQAEKAVTENSKMVTEILKMVAPTFEYNPRRLKQFINAFRLKTFIASRTGLFGEPKDLEKYDRLTPQQLGKFVAISLRWPLLLADLDNDRKLLSRLQKMALDKVSPGAVEDWGFEVTDALARWHNRDGLRQLLRSGCYSGDRLDPDGIGVYGLGRLDVNKLLQVSPLTKPLNKELSANDSSNAKPDLNQLDPDRRTTTRIDTSVTYPKVIGQY